jgi:PQQ-like domain
LWNYHAGGPVHTRPLPAQNIIVFGGGDNKAWAVMADEPTILYRLLTGGPIGEGFGAYGTRTLLVPSGDKILYAVDLFTSRVLWTFPSGAPISQEPIVADQDVYVVNGAGDLSSIDPNTGQPRWTISTQGGRLVSISPTKLYLRSYNLDLFIVDRATGRIVADPSETHLRTGLNLREYEWNIVNRFTDRLYFGTRSGLILAIRESGLPEPKLLRDPKQPPFGYVPPEGIKDIPPTPPAAEPGAAPEGGQPPAGQEAAPDANAPPAAEKKDAEKKPE